MDKLPELARLSEPEKDALIAALWAEVQLLKAGPAALEVKEQEPRKDAHNLSVPPSQTPKASGPSHRLTGGNAPRGQCGPCWGWQAAAPGPGPSPHGPGQGLFALWWRRAGP